MTDVVPEVRLDFETSFSGKVLRQDSGALRVEIERLQNRRLHIRGSFCETKSQKRGAFLLERLRLAITYDHKGARVRGLRTEQWLREQRAWARALCSRHPQR